MNKDREIKGMNRKYLVVYMFLNFLIFGWLSGGFIVDSEAANRSFRQLLNPSHLVGLMIIPLCLILEGLISSELKHKLVFLRLKHPLPGVL